MTTRKAHTRHVNGKTVQVRAAQIKGGKKAKRGSWSFPLLVGGGAASLLSVAHGNGTVAGVQVVLAVICWQVARMLERRK